MQPDSINFRLTRNPTAPGNVNDCFDKQRQTVEDKLKLSEAGRDTRDDNGFARNGGNIELPLP